MNRNDAREAERPFLVLSSARLASRQCLSASGSYDWENRYENGIWTYSLEEVWTGLQESYRKLSEEVFDNYNTRLQTIGAIGFSAMMHGCVAFDKNGNLLVPFPHMANTTTGQATTALTELFQFNVPHRWSVAHLTTLAGYDHWKLTGQKVLGVGDASCMFPINSKTNDYDASKIALPHGR